MERFTNSIESSLLAKNWFGALFMALALPDICAALEDPSRPVGERYRDWFQRYLRAIYDPSSMYEVICASSPQTLETLPEHIKASLKAQVPPKEAALTAADCYLLRCKCLHQGLPERSSNDRIHFTVPDPAGRLNVHRNNFNGVLQISVDRFCRDIAQAVLIWWNSAKTDTGVAARAEQLIKMYGLDDRELPIVSYGA